MAINLVSLVSQALTPQLIGQIGSAIGANPAVAQKLVGGAVPTVIAALAGVAGQTGGAQKISDLVNNADSDALGKLTGGLAGGQSDVLSQGVSALSGIVGGSGLSSLAGALGQFSGATPAQAQSAIGAVSQALVGVLGQQDPSLWQDASSIASTFASQKDSIVSALPAGLGSLLTSSGMLAGIGGVGAAAASRATSTVSSTVTSASSAASGALNQASSTASSTPTWLIVVAAVVVLVAIAWYFSRGSAPPAAPAVAPAATPTPSPSPSKAGMLDGSWVTFG